MYKFFRKTLTVLFAKLPLSIQDNFGSAGNHLRYGKVKGHELVIGNNIWAASQVIANQSGKFVYNNDGALTLCVDGTAQIFGWAQEYAHTPTVGDIVGVNIALDAVYRIPIISGTYVVGMMGDVTDLEVSSSIQGAKLDASGENLVIIVGGDLVDNEWVDVKVNPVVQGAAVGSEA